MTQIPIYNVNNNCSTGSTGLHIARNMVSHGMADCVMVVGFEKMFPGSLGTFFKDRANPTGTSGEIMRVTRGFTNAPGAAQMFGNAGREYMEKYGSLYRPCPDLCADSKPQGTVPSQRTSQKLLASTTHIPPRIPTRNSATYIPSSKY